MNDTIFTRDDEYYSQHFEEQEEEMPTTPDYRQLIDPKDVLLNDILDIKFPVINLFNEFFVVDEERVRIRIRKDGKLYTKIKNRPVLKFLERKLVIKGPIQGKKTNMMFGLISRLTLMNMSVLLVLRPYNVDLTQTNNRFNNNINDFCEEMGISRSEISLHLLDSNASEKELSNFILAKSAKIHIIIDHQTQLAKIANCIEKVKNKRNIKLVVFFDEVDSTDSDNAEVRRPLIKTIKDNSKLCIGVSATILGVCAEWDIPPYCVLEMPNPDLAQGTKYLGLEDLDFIETNTGRENIKQNDSIEKIFENCKDLKNFLLTTEGCTLVNITRFEAPYQELYKWCINNRPNNGYLLNVGKGIKIYHPKLGNKPINLCGSKSEVSNNSHIFSDKVDVGAALGKLEEIGVKNVICFSGAKAGRAVTFSSTFNKRIDRLHLETAFIKLSNDITQDNIMQLFGRLCAIVGNNVQHTVYCNRSDFESLSKAHNLQKELLERTTKKYAKTTIKPIFQGNGNIINVPVHEIIQKTTGVGCRALLSDIQISEFKLKFTNEHTGRKKQRDITNRKSVNPIKVEDDGTGITEEDYEFASGREARLEREAREAEENENGEGATRDALTRLEKKIVEILQDGSILTPVKIWKEFISRGWNNMSSARRPEQTISTTCIRMNQLNILKRVGTSGNYKYCIRV